MWEFLARQLLKEAGRKIGGKFFNDEANGPEAYADRIKRDFHLHDYADAWALYDSDRAYWERFYSTLPTGPDRNNVFVRDSAAAAGVPSRNNVFEYGFPESSSARPSMREVAPVRRSATQDPTPLEKAALSNFAIVGSPSPAGSGGGRYAPFRAPGGEPIKQYGTITRDGFDGRFGKWGSVPADSFGETRSPVLRALEKYRRSAAPDGAVSTLAQGAAPASNLPGEEFVFDDRSGDAPAAPRPDAYPRLRTRMVSSAFPGITPRNPNLLVPPPEPGRPLGIFTGKPMPLWTTPLPLAELLSNSNASGDANWFTTPGGLSWDGNKARASTTETSVPGSPIASSGNPNSVGGLPGLMAPVLAGIDPQIPDQRAPSAGGLLGLYMNGRR